MPATRKKPFLGWSVVSAGFLLQLLTSGAMHQTYGAYFVQMQREFGWSRTTLSASYSLLQIISGVVGPIQGRVIDRIGPQRVAFVGVIFFGAGLIGLGFIHSLFAYYAAFVVIAFGGALCGFITLMVVAGNWFQRRRTAAIAVIGMGLGLGGLLAPVVALAINQVGWRTTMTGSGVAFLLIALPAVRFLRNQPEDYGLRPDGDAGGEVLAKPARRGFVAVKLPNDFTLGEAMRTPAFWLISLGHASALLVVSTVNVHLINYLVEREMSLQLASAMYSVTTVFQIVGQLVGGVIADRMNKRILAMLGMAGHLIAMFILAFSGNIAWVLLFAIVHGTAWGVRGPLMSSIRADYFGRSSFGSIMGVSTFILILGSVGGPLSAAFLADTTGDYRLAFIIVGLLSGLGSLFFLTARKPAKKIAVAAQAEQQSA